MSEEIVSASGERAAMGGYLPQFDEFAWFVYLNLINKKLEWIRIADPKAEKLDDIQYSTHSEIHAYQVKWTIADANISFANFKELLPLITSSWKSVKSANPSKEIKPHLITNKPASLHDIVKDGDIKIGSFADFLSEAWLKIKANQLVDSKWKPILEELRIKTNLNVSEFEDFVTCFDFQHSYQKKDFEVKKTPYSKEDEDLVRLTRFLWEEAGGTDRNIEFSRQKIIQRLGWSDRFKTIFNHELIVDKQRYQPIQSTINLLNSKLSEHEGGYLFLQGGPGSGKSTLLSEWSRNIESRVIKYYAFDFRNPSSLIYPERGKSTVLYFDLVFQLKEKGFYKKNILPYFDSIFLKKVFEEQLRELGEDFIKNSKKTILIIDGLDHIPREYKRISDNFLKELPPPKALPKGVFIILGSQSYELEDLQQEIKSEFNSGNRTIQIDSLKKEDVYKYIDNFDSSIQLNSSQRLQVFEKSQGHPLYLSYLMEKIYAADSIDDTIESFVAIDGSIDTYYKKIWKPIENEHSLIQFLGLIARINGSINLKFIQEWGFDRSVLKSFQEKARVLFNETEKSLSFFHNSFKQFLLDQTSLDYLTGEPDPNVNIGFHNQLADYYIKSEFEKSWKQNHHLFQAQQYDKFISVVTPDSFTEQLLNFRPAEEIKQDAKLGIEIARQGRDINSLVRYLFSLAEIERRLFNIDPASFTEELLFLNKFDLARDYLRTGNNLHCSESYAFKACRLFIEFGHKSEGATLYNLAYPEIITDIGILIDDSHRYEEIRDSLEEWIYTAPFFESTKNIFSIIDKIQFSDNIRENRFEEKESDLQLRLLSNLGYSLVDQNKWDDFNKVTEKIDATSSKGRNSLFQLIKYAIEQCLDLKDNSRANEFLSLLIIHFTKEKTKPIGRIFIADLVYKVTGDLNETYSWIKEVEQPSNVGKKDRLGYDDSLDAFLPLIKLNKLLNLSGNGVSITSAIPIVANDTDEEVLVEFERMLCITTQILAEGILQTPMASDPIKRVIPIVRFYYKEISPRNSYWYKLTQAKGQYFDFLISAVSQLGSVKLELLGDYLFGEFQNSPKYWSTSIQRKIIKSLLYNGLDAKKAVIQLRSLENSMLDDHDIDGRITECLAHSKVWFILDELEETEKWLKQAIQESIGVGYRKDYQFSTWIEWLRKINHKDPSSASERIKWFLSHLNHIKETTDGRAYWNASEELLAVTFEHNLNDGLEQAIWQLEYDLIDFKDTISLFIKHFVLRTKSEEEFKNIVQLYINLYLLLAESADSSLLKSILEKGHEILKEGFLTEYAQAIISAIEIKAYEETRHYLLSEFDDFYKSKGLKAEDYYSSFNLPEKNERDSSSSSSNTLVLKTDHKRIDESEVLERVTNFDDFKKIIQEEDQANSFFNWSKVIEKMTPLLSSSQIEEVTKLARIGRKESDFYAKLSEAALTLGNTELAIGLANKSIELSSESGWVKFYDGGTRINAFSALQRINPEISSNKAFEVFAHDIVSSNYPSSYIEHLEDIIPLLTENYVEEELWPEIYGYLQRLMSNSKPVENLPILPSLDRPIMETLVDYLVYLSESPVSLVKEQSLLLLAKYINQDDDYAFTQLLNGRLDDYSCVDVIMKLSAFDSPKVHSLKSKINSLALSNDYQLRKNAIDILSSIKEEIPTPKSIQLPKVYSLHIPENGKPDFKKEIDPYFPEVDINSPRDLIGPFVFLIKILSEESGIDESNLIYRAYSIMKEIGREEEWTVEYEKKLRNHLEEIYLKYSYPRPRVIAARRAIMHVANELIDSGTIDDKRIQNVLMSHDYAVQFFNEKDKPEFIQTIKERDFGGVGNDWLHRIGESKRLYESLLDYNENFKIIAEYNQVINLDWGSPTEKYMYQIAVNDELNEDDNYIFGSVFHQLSKNYHDMRSGGHFIVVIRDHRFDQLDLKSKWIAFNPVLATHLGWEPEPSKLFAWKNSEGELMAESIYWSNGNNKMTPRKDGEVGEGWFVIVSNNGLEQIKSIEKNLFLQKKLTRSKYEDSVLMNNQKINVTKI